MAIVKKNSDDEQLKQYSYDASTNDAYQVALNQLKQAQSQTPTYKGTYDQQIKDMYDKIANREKFSYDLNGDALYNQYKNQYTQQGKLAMMDTMGQAAALTGGYGNSYAQNVGQQAYQGALQQLNNVVPELYGMALNQYNQEGDNLLQQYNMLGNMADTEYGRYQDALNQYWQNVNYQQQLADTAYNRGYENWYNAYQNQYQAGRDQVADRQWQQQYDEALRQYEQNFQYQQNRDQVADQQWNQSFQYQQNRDQVADSQWQQQFDEALRQYNEQFGYQKDRDAVADSRYETEWQYQQDRDKTADERYQAEFDYQKSRDDVADQRYENEWQYQQDRDTKADEKWQTEFDEALRQYNEQFGYQKDRDTVADERYQKEFEYQQGRDQVADSQWDQSFQYQQGRDQVSDSQWQKEFDEAKRQYDEQFGFAKEQYADSKKTSSSTSSTTTNTTSNKSTGGGGWDNQGYDASLVKQAQQFVGTDVDGLWGSDSTAKAKAKGYNSLAEVIEAMNGPGKTIKDYSKTENQAAQAENGGSFYADTLADLKSMKKSGKSNSEVSAFLQEMVGNSLLTPSEYSTLYNKYRNNSL